MGTLVCVPIMVRDLASALADAGEARRAGADLVEYRIDDVFHGEGDDEGERLAVRLCAETPLPCIVTCRSAEEGGHYDGDDRARIALYERLATAFGTMDGAGGVPRRGGGEAASPHPPAAPAPSPQGGEGGAGPSPAAALGHPLPGGERANSAESADGAKSAKSAKSAESAESAKRSESVESAESAERGERVQSGERERREERERSAEGQHPPRFIDVELSTLERSANLRQKVRLAVDHPEQVRDVRTSLIVSTHDFRGRPTDLTRRIVRMRAEPAAKVLKIAYRARSLRDNLELFDVLSARDRATIALGMGEFGLMSRVLAPKFGGFLTFASLRESGATAPGQPTIRELLETYRFRSITATTAVYGVIGWPVGHSMSPRVHNAGFGAIGFDGVYVPMPVAGGGGESPSPGLAALGHPLRDREREEGAPHPAAAPASSPLGGRGRKEPLAQPPGARAPSPHWGESGCASDSRAGDSGAAGDGGYESLKATLLEFIAHEQLGFGGASVTIPHKEHVLRLALEMAARAGETGVAWEIDPLAARIGAANTVVVERTAPGGGAARRVRVLNTDAPAAVSCLTDALGSLAGRRVAVVGAGGVARAIAGGLLEADAVVRVFNRSRGRAEALARELAAAFSKAAGRIEAGEMDELAGAAFDAFVNCTPVGMAGGPAPGESAIAVGSLRGCRENAVVMDTVYNPVETATLRAARARGLGVVDGLGMFVRQAEMQFEAWTGRPAPAGLFERVARAGMGVEGGARR